MICSARLTSRWCLARSSQAGNARISNQSDAQAEALTIEGSLHDLPLESLEFPFTLLLRDFSRPPVEVSAQEQVLLRGLSLFSPTQLRTQPEAPDEEHLVLHLGPVIVNRKRERILVRIVRCPPLLERCRAEDRGGTGCKELRQF